MSREKIKIHKLEVSYRQGSSSVRVLSDLKVSFARGKFSVVLGPSGCGKTTLLLAISNLFDFDDIASYRGTVSIFGLSPLKARRKKLIGMAFQDPSLLPWLSVYENVVLPLRISRSDINYSEVHEIIKFCGLEGYENFYPSQLSGGMSQRVNLARALILRPKLLLLDEPVAHLDYISRLELLRFMREIHDEFGMTTIMVTHDLREAVLVADYVYVFVRRYPTRMRRINVRKDRFRGRGVLDDAQYVLDMEKVLVGCLRNFR